MRDPAPTHLFNRAFGLPLARFLVERRLTRAAGLLTTTGDGIESIAHACGFANRSHLTRLFSRRLGVGPAR